MKDGAAKTKTAKSANGAAAATAKGGKDVKGAAKASKAAAIPAGKAGKNAKPAEAKAGKAGAAGKKAAAPPAPPRKIQVVQLTTLKPGARGTKASVAHRAVGDGSPVLPADADKASAAKKRRSAELTPPQLAHFRELLSTRRARLNSDLSMMQDEALKVTAQDNSSDSVADTGTDNYEQDFTLGLIESEEALAREVDAALVRLEQNAFGVCEACQTPIPLARLEILPFARHCVECQQKREGKS